MIRTRRGGGPGVIPRPSRFRVSRSPRFAGFHHVQVAMPAGEEEAAERFSGLLGMEQVPKPKHLAARGGCWFRSGGVELHLGVEEDFRAARKAHPGFLVEDLAEVRGRLERAGAEIQADTQLEGHDQFYAFDPFGNRLEFIARA